MRVKLTQLDKLVGKALIKYGYSVYEAKIIKRILLYAQLRGNNQGIVKLIGKGIPKNPQAKKTQVVKETKLSALLNGGQNMGMVVLSKAMDLAISKAKKHGFGIVGTNNTSSSTGAIGYYAREIAKQNLIGFVFAGSPETVSTYGSFEPIFGTNPLAIGIPSTGEPIVLDMATAIMAYYGLIEAKTAGKSIPEGIAYDASGKFTTDPAKAMDGALLPFDKGRKGAGLSFIVEALTGLLVAATFVGIGQSNNWGNLIMAIDPQLLVNLKTFKKNVLQLGKRVKVTKKLPGVSEILLPGERGNRLTNQRLKSKEIEIEDNLYKELIKVSE